MQKVGKGRGGGSAGVRGSAGEEAGENQQLLCPAEPTWAQAGLMEGGWAET